VSHETDLANVQRTLGFGLELANELKPKNLEIQIAAADERSANDAVLK